ncbi:MAG: fibronectin type III domain-containing protein [Kofleriaceae bacterium]
MKHLGMIMVAAVALGAGCVGDGESWSTLEQRVDTTTVSATAISPTRIEVSWTVAADATKYYVFRAVGSDPLAYVTTVTGTSYSDAGLSPSTDYSYMVRGADDLGGESADSNIATATTPAAPQQIGIPSDVTAAAVSSSRIEVDWSDVSGAVKYYVFQAQGAGSFAYVGTALNSDFTAASLAAATTYSFHMQAVDALDVESADSATASATTFLPGASGAAAVAVSASRIEMTWDAVPGASKYYLFQAEGAGAFAYVTTAQTTGYVAAGLNANTTYSFQIQSVDSFDQPSPEIATTAATTFPAGSSVSPPANVGATALSPSRIDVAWDSVAGATKYYVFQAQGAGPSMYVGTALTNSWEAIGLSANTSYSYVIQAVDSADLPSTDSAVASATTPSDAPPLAAPANLSATAVSSSQIELSWDAVTGAANYYVFLSTVGGPLYVTTVTAPQTSLSASGLQANTEYTYVVEAVDAAGGRSVASAPATATTFE